MQNNYLYDKLPKVYRDFDEDETLKRFLSTLEEQGVIYLFDEIKGLKTLIDVDKCPSRFLPYLFETYGMPYDYSIPELFQRKFLKNISYLYNRKGTKSVLRYLGRELSGYNVDIIDDEEDGHFILMIRAFVEDEVNLLVSIDVIEKYLKFFIPLNAFVRLAVSYGFSDEIAFNFEDEDGILSIKDLEEIEKLFVMTPENQKELYDTETTDIVDDLTDPSNIDENKTLLGDVTSIINYGILSHNMFTNHPNGTETIYNNGVKSFYIY